VKDDTVNIRYMSWLLMGMKVGMGIKSCEWVGLGIIILFPHTSNRNIRSWYTSR